MASPKPNPSPDSAKLLKILNNISSELDHPYIERRLKTISQKSNPLDELQDAINHINQRENDLQACIGIARVLAENNDELLKEKENLENSLKEKNVENRKLSEEITRLEDELDISEEKFKNVNSILADSQKFTSTQKIRNNEVDIISIEKHESDIAEIKEKFKSEYDHMLRMKVEADKKFKSSEQKLTECQKTVEVLENQLDEYLKKLKSCEKTIKKLEASENQLKEDLANEISTRSELERLYDEQYNKNQELIYITEIQAEKLEMLQNSSTPQAPISGSHQREPSSLQLELEEIGESDEYHDHAPVLSQPKPTITYLDPKKSMNTDARKSTSYDIRKSFNHLDLRKSFKMTPRTLGSFKQVSIHIRPRNHRRSPPEEYFFLAAQAMKLNSAYIDTICTVCPMSLFQRATKNQVPFNKWHLWIEQQLNASYLEAIYKKVRKESKSN